jgi:putative nucleotidyltransferase with HDIG domain
MPYRVRQFVRGLTAPVIHIDYALAREHLDREEMALFQRLPAHEKRHALDTARTIEEFQVGHNKDVLIKAALLHDIGKSGSGIGIVRKSVMVLMDRYFSSISRNLSKRIKMFGIYYNHPDIGANMLESIGTDVQVVQLVRYHQSAGMDDIEGLDYLKKADSIN